MPVARPLPKKFLASLEDAQANLRLMAQRARLALEEVETQRRPMPQTQTVLREIEAVAYRLALDISRLEVAGTCDICPSAPATTTAQAHLLVLASELERQAELARQWANARQVSPLVSAGVNAPPRDAGIANHASR